MDANLQGLVLDLISAAIVPQVVQLINQILGTKKPCDWRTPDRALLTRSKEIMTHTIEKLNSVIAYNWKWYSDVLDYELVYWMKDRQGNEFAAIVFADGESVTGLKALKHKGFVINASDDLISEILEMANEDYQAELAEIYA